MVRRGRRILPFVAVLLTAALAACGTAPPHRDAEGRTVIKIGDSFSATHPVGAGGVQPFRDHLEEHGPGVGLAVEYFASGQVGDQGDMPAILRSGVVQMAPVSPAYVGTELPLSNVGDLPGLVPDACTGGDAVLGAMQPGGTLFETELAPHGIRPLWAAVVPDYEAMSTRTPIARPEDAAGRLVRSTGGVADRVVDSMGAAGVSMPLGELYEALSRDTVSGTVASPVSIGSYKLGEALDHTTDGARLGAFTITFSVSEPFWASLDDAQRGVITEAAALAQDGVCRAITETGEAALAEMREQGVQVSPVSAADRAAWDALAEPVRRQWVADLERSGHPATRVLQEFEESLARAGAGTGSTP